MKHFPVINLNGTSYEELVRQQEDVIEKINAAIAAMEEALPHGRDYVLNTHATSQDIAAEARKEHVGRMLQLIKVRDEHAQLLERLVRTHLEQERMHGRAAR